MHASRTYLVPTAFLTMVVVAVPPANAQIYNRDTGQVIPGTEGITPPRGGDTGTQLNRFARFCHWC